MRFSNGPVFSLFWWCLTLNHLWWSLYRRCQGWLWSLSFLMREFFALILLLITKTCRWAQRLIMPTYTSLILDCHKSKNHLERQEHLRRIFSFFFFLCSWNELWSSLYFSIWQLLSLIRQWWEGWSRLKHLLQSCPHLPILWILSIFRKWRS